MDYQYEKDDAKSLLKRKYIGMPTFFYGVPNVVERGEMVYRALLKQYDNDLFKYRVLQY